MRVSNVVASEGRHSTIRRIRQLQLGRQALLLLIELKSAAQVSLLHSLISDVSRSGVLVCLVLEQSKTGHRLAMHFLRSGKITLRLIDQAEVVDDGGHTALRSNLTVKGFRQLIQTDGLGHIRLSQRIRPMAQSCGFAVQVSGRSVNVSGFAAGRNCIL